MRGLHAKRKVFLSPAHATESSSRRTILGVGLGQLAVECIHQGAFGRRLSAGAIGLQRLTDMLDGRGRLPAVIGVAAEHVREQSGAQEGVRHDLFDDRHRTSAAHHQQRPGPGEVGRRRVLGQQMFHTDLPVAGDLGDERAAVSRQRGRQGADIDRRRRPGEVEEDDARCDGRR